MWIQMTTPGGKGPWIAGSICLLLLAFAVAFKTDAREQALNSPDLVNHQDEDSHSTLFGELRGTRIEPNPTEIPIDEVEPDTEAIPNSWMGLPRGVLFGCVYDFDGVPLTNYKVHFEPDGDIQGTVCRTNHMGNYQKSLPPGLWTVSMVCHEKESQGVVGSIPLGEVQVIEDGRHMLDLYEAGTHQLMGGISLRPGLKLGNELNLQPNEAVGVTIKLLDPYDTSRVIATAFSGANKSKHDRYLARISPENTDVRSKPVKYEPGLGWFSMSGLDPAVYELRAYLDVAEKYYVSMRIDLTKGNMEFEPIYLSEEDFFSHRVLEL